MQSEEIVEVEIKEEVAVETLKETLELAHAGGRLASFAKTRLIDGAQVEDAVALGQKLLNDESFRSDLIAGVMGVQNVVVEVKANHSFEELAKIGAAFVAGWQEK